ncbi:FMN-binding negative transcriptional regulator [Ectobacillus ponti]|uniref:FMN-binding negative transcriptional regulator n=1 Tax=Ectobacillus ponti TaxID=2961894 RepID=A0AA41XAW1_9BACI|nr:FMN-binding negative transcriptional regulator [Ectobacillus ponti]MCP8970115.1 FMN-binding negative transcriptional regulator [Ectobacillus ponti]
MYIPKHFQLTDQEEMYKVMEENSFAIIFSMHNGKPFATHLPLLLDREQQCLLGHFARPNPQWRDMEGQEILVTFQGPHCYISPSWYEIQEAVPTWNYVAVHVYGTVEFVEDADLGTLVRKYEKAGSPYRLEDLNESYMDGMKKGIVPFKIQITSMEGKAKLSQNHPAERQELVITQLGQSEGENEKGIAGLMKKNLPIK